MPAAFYWFVCPLGLTSNIFTDLFLMNACSHSFAFMPCRSHFWYPYRPIFFMSACSMLLVSMPFFRYHFQSNPAKLQSLRWALLESWLVAILCSFSGDPAKEVSKMKSPGNLRGKTSGIFFARNLFLFNTVCFLHCAAPYALWVPSLS